MHETVVAIVTVMVYMLNKLVIRITTRLCMYSVCDDGMLMHGS